VYAQLSGHAFLEFDDGLYVTGNPRIAEGLTLENFLWAWVSTDAYIWHPITWLSYLIDGGLHGVESAGPWLLTNLALHVACSLALLGSLASLTGRFWPSAFVAALFALHPIQTEPVAWVSGRKEVLAGLFFVLTLWAYARYARQRDRRSYLGVFAAMAMCLLAKGTHVAIPFLLLLLDYWPLGRLRLGPGGERWTQLIAEKLPLLALSLAMVAVQAAAVAAPYSPWITDPPLFDRAQDGIMATTATLGRLLWPDSLAIVYPTRTQMGLPQVGVQTVAAALAGLVAATTLAAAAGAKRGYLLVGWLWFLGMLFPVIGLIPSGLRVMHDRYAYIPMIGLSIAFAFGVAELLARLRVPRAIPAAAATAVLASLAVASWQQAGVWRDSLTLFDHALAVTERNAIVHFLKGNTLSEAQNYESARVEFEAALAIHPSYPDAHNNLGLLYLKTKRIDLAIPHFERALAARPKWGRARTNLANAQWSSGDRSGALASFEAAVEASPESADAHYWLAAARHESGMLAAAAEGYREALRIDPRHEWARRGLDGIEKAAR
ncbi:MAG: tetratricopeptide repeat protein, partial [Myxococcota bacterium]